MTEKHICAFYSEGGFYATVLKELRTQNPSARICAVVPSGYALAHTLRPLADDVIETELAHYSPRDLQACGRLVRMLRAKRFDLFIVLFSSMQLRLLAAASGGRRAECWDQYHRIAPMSATLPGWAVGLVVRNALGWFRWLNVWFQVHAQRVAPGGPAS